MWSLRVCTLFLHLWPQLSCVFSLVLTFLIAKIKALG